MSDYIVANLIQLGNSEMEVTIYIYGAFGCHN